VQGQENWIDLYTAYTDKQESPRIFQVWSAISVIASCLGRRVYIDRGYFTTYPNQYIILAAETARCRKSSAAEIAIDDIVRTSSLIDVLSERLTTEAICVKLSKDTGVDNSILIFCTELSTFLGAGAMQSGKVDMLTSFYNCPHARDYLTKNSGKFVCRNICINILACTTLNWMADNMPGTTIEGGFTGRVLFVVGEEPRCIEPAVKGGLSKDKQLIRQALITDLARIASLNGEFHLDAQSSKLYATWYRKLRISPVKDPRLSGYYSRKGEHVLKTAMAFKAAEFHVHQEKDLIINVDHIKRAIWELDNIEKLMPLAYRGASYAKSSKDNDRILRQLEKMGGVCDHSLLLRKNSYYLDAVEFKKVMQTLTESKQVKECTDGKKHYYELLKEKI